MSEMRLSADGERSFMEAQQLCLATNVAIVAPEHVLAGALLVLHESGHAGLPEVETVARAIVATQAVGDAALQDSPMFGSAARQAISECSRIVRQSGGSEIGALELALGTIASGEVNPMFYGALGLTKQDLIATLGS